MVIGKVRDAKSRSWKRHSDLYNLLLQYPFNMVTNLEGGRKVHLLSKTVLIKSKNSCNHYASFPNESVQDTLTSLERVSVKMK